MNNLKLKKPFATALLLASASLFQVESVFAFPYESGTGVRTYECKEIKGQKCDNGRHIRLYTPHKSHHYLHIKNPNNSCSSLRYKIDISGGRVTVTNFLNPGMAQNIRLDMNPPIRNSTGLRYFITIIPEGRLGGCNLGKISSWGFEARLFKSNPPSTPFIPLKGFSGTIPKNKVLTPPKNLSIPPIRKVPQLKLLDTAVKENTCFNLVQDKVAWDKAGRKKRWSPQYIKKLCKKTRNPHLTVNCFKRRLQHTNSWKLAIASCAQK